VAITHTKVSAIPDDADTSLVRPSDWNAAHTVANDSLAIAHTAGLQTALNTLTAAAAPGGSDTQIQFNDGGAFGASAAVTFLSPDTSWGGTVLKVYEDDTSSAVLSAVSDNGDGWLGADSFNTINSSTGNLVTYGPSGLWLGRGRGSSTVRGDVLANDGLGMIKFAGICQSGVRFESAAHIGAEVKEIGTYIGANLVFGTKPMANSNPLYRMRLDADGGLVLRASSTTDPTGGSQGAGTINATGLYVNGTAVAVTESMVIACSDETTALTTGAAKVTFRMPYAMTLTSVRASVSTAPTGAALQVDINETGSGTILSTKLTIDAGEKTSTTAAVPAVISDTALADDAEITIDIDTVGSTVAGAGLKVYLIGTRA
jgi:hypothetical protein